MHVCRKGHDQNLLVQVECSLKRWFDAEVADVKFDEEQDQESWGQPLARAGSAWMVRTNCTTISPIPLLPFERDIVFPSRNDAQTAEILSLSQVT